MALQQQHPTFDDINDGILEEVQRRVRADAAVLEEREEEWGETPLIYAIWERKPAIALWLIEHRGQHDLETANTNGETALHWASRTGLLSVVEALVGAGANPAVLDGIGWTPLIWAALPNYANVVAFLLQQPAVKATIDAVTRHYPCTALSIASHQGHPDIVQLLLDAGADPTIPAGPKSPLNLAISQATMTSPPSSAPPSPSPTAPAPSTRPGPSSMPPPLWPRPQQTRARRTCPWRSCSGRCWRRPRST